MLGQAAPSPDPPRELVRTVTDANVRDTFFDLQAVHFGFNPSEYVEIDARISNVSPQSSHR